MAKSRYTTMDVVRQGAQIVLPVDMDYSDAISWIERKMEAEEQVITLNRQYRAFPLDGAAALARTIAKLFGWAAKVSTWASPPTTIALPMPGGEQIEVPWGRFAIPGVNGYVESDMTKSREGLPVYVLQARTKEKDRPKIMELFLAVEQELQQHSIYRGQAIRFEFPSDGEFDPSIAPEFLDLTRVNPEELVFRSDVQELVDTTVFGPILYPTVVRNQQVPLKRGILLEGPYGVGKTLLAYVVAQKATAQGWTYLYANVRQLAQAIEFALLYEPCVIFAEDVDQIVGTQDRDQGVNEVLNTIDGVNVKGREVMVILTTNHVDKINQAMLRWGRLDTVISIPPPDAEAATKLVELYSRGQLAWGTDLSEVGTDLAGQIPAMIREVVERAKLGAIVRGQGQPGPITAHDLRVAARGMKRHLSLLTPKLQDKRSDSEKAAQIVADALTTVSESQSHSGYRPDPRAFESFSADNPNLAASTVDPLDYDPDADSY